MKSFRMILLLVYIALTVAPNYFAQNTKPTVSETEKEKEREERKKKALALTELIIGEAALLKIPENRIFLQINAANSLWPLNEKRARLLFEQAGETIVELLNESETDDNGVPQNLYAVQESRRNLLMMAAARDAELALSLLIQTRPAIVNQLNGMPTTSQTYNNYSWLLQNEANLQQQFAQMAAAQNPRRAAEIVRKSLEHGFSYEIINTINKIKIKESDLAIELANEVLNKLKSADFAKQYEARNLSFQLIQLTLDPANSGAEQINKTIKLNQQNVRELTDKLAAFYLKLKPEEPTINEVNGNNLVIFEKFSPNRAAQLRRRLNELQQNNPDAQKWERLNKLNDSSVDSMLAEAPNFTPEMQTNLYTTAANKASEAGDEQRALSIINRIPSSKQRSFALDSYKWQLFNRALQAKKFAAAHAIALQTEKNNLKINFLVMLAKTLKEANDQDQAVQLLNDARALIVANPSNQDELHDYVLYTRGTIEVDPQRTFNLLEVLVDNLNEMIAAHQTLSKFNNQNQYFRDGEMILNNFSHQIWNYLPIQDQETKVLAEFNFERILDLANRFQRPEPRLLLKAQLARTILLEFDKQNPNSIDKPVQMQILSNLKH